MTDRLARLRALLRPVVFGGVPRRCAALVLSLLAVTLAVWPSPSPSSSEPTVPMLVASDDLPSGTTLADGRVAVVRVPERLRPRSALDDPASASGRVLAAGIGRGEPITSSRLIGPESTRLAAGSDAELASVPIRLADAGVAGLLRPGVKVDVVTAQPRDGAPVLLARDATVVTVRDDEESGSPGRGKGRLVVIALVRDSATRIASISLAQPVTVTLR